MPSIRLTRKLAKFLDGVDVSTVNVGDIIEVSAPVARMLIKEGWAQEVEDLSQSDPPDERPRA